MRIVVAGGGIAGLACAAGLARMGHDMVVLERRPEFGELGAGIQIAPNGFRALDELGVAEAVLASSVRVDDLTIRDGLSGEHLIGLRTDADYEATFGYPYAVVQRSDLYQPLLDACRQEARIELRTGAYAVGYAHQLPGVRVILQSGEELIADALIGADGIRSAIRRQLVGDGDPVVSGHTIYRAVIDMECVPLELRATRVTLWAAEDWHFVHYPIAGGAKLNLAITRDDGAVDAISGEAVTDRVVLDSFRHAHPEVRQLLGLGRNWRKWVLCSRPRLDDWSDGAVVLVGDAAHPMLQYAAQGASMALEDAVLLARLMPVDVQSVSLAFAELSALRSERAAKVQWVSEEMGRQVYHARDRAQADRNAWLRGFTEQDLRAALGWLHGATEFTESVAERHPARAAS